MSLTSSFCGKLCPVQSGFIAIEFNKIFYGITITGGQRPDPLIFRIRRNINLPVNEIIF